MQTNDSYSLIVRSRIKHIRKNILKLKQTDIAEDLGINQSAISHIENKSIVSEHTVNILKYFSQKNININWIFYEDNQHIDVYILEESSLF